LSKRNILQRHAQNSQEHEMTEVLDC